MTPSTTVTAGPSVRPTSAPRLRRAVHLFLGVVTIMLGVWAGLRWSLIAVGVDARITSTSWAEEGPALKVLEFEGGRTLTIDDDLMARLGATGPLPGRHLQTEPGSTVATLDGAVVPLRWSTTASKTVVALVGIVAVSVVRRRRTPSSGAVAPPEVSG